MTNKLPANAITEQCPEGYYALPCIDCEGCAFNGATHCTDESHACLGCGCTDCHSRTYYCSGALRADERDVIFLPIPKESSMPTETPTIDPASSTETAARVRALPLPDTLNRLLRITARAEDTYVRQEAANAIRELLGMETE